MTHRSHYDKSNSKANIKGILLEILLHVTSHSESQSGLEQEPFIFIPFILQHQQHQIMGCLPFFFWSIIQCVIASLFEKSLAHCKLLLIREMIILVRRINYKRASTLMLPPRFTQKLFKWTYERPSSLHQGSCTIKNKETSKTGLVQSFGEIAVGGK